MKWRAGWISQAASEAAVRWQAGSVQAGKAGMPAHKPKQLQLLGRAGRTATCPSGLAAHSTRQRACLSPPSRMNSGLAKHAVMAMVGKPSRASAELLAMSGTCGHAGRQAGAHSKVTFRSSRGRQARQWIQNLPQMLERTSPSLHPSNRQMSTTKLPRQERPRKWQGCAASLSMHWRTIRHSTAACACGQA